MIQNLRRWIDQVEYVADLVQGRVDTFIERRRLEVVRTRSWICCRQTLPPRVAYRDSRDARDVELSALVRAGA
jgi:hypothetical protein